MKFDVNSLNSAWNAFVSAASAFNDATDNAEQKRSDAVAATDSESAAKAKVGASLTSVIEQLTLVLDAFNGTTGDEE